MHELPLVQEVLRLSLAYAQENHAEKLQEIVLGVGELRDLAEEWVERYFAYAARGSIAEGARIRVERYPVICRCRNCGENILVHMDSMEKVVCPECGGEEMEIISGKELRIERIVIT